LFSSSHFRSLLTLDVNVLFAVYLSRLNRAKDYTLLAMKLR